MDIQTRLAGDVQIFELSGRFDNYSSPQLAERLEEATRTAPAHIIVSLNKVTFVDSTGLATLVQGMKRSRQHGGDLYLSGLQRSVYMIFELTRLDKAFNIFVDEDHALQAFSS